MSIKAGTNDVTKVYLGSTEVSKVYKGSTEVWSAVPPLPDGTVDVMILAGGGGHTSGGGPPYYNGQGGGGGGGMLEIVEYTLQVGQQYDILVGAGGPGSGSNSSIRGTGVHWIAEGGGGQITGGGCGGGEMGTMNNPAGWIGAGPGTEGQGFEGGLSESSSNQTAGGGGGATGGKGYEGRLIAGLAMGGNGAHGRAPLLEPTIRLGSGGGAGATTINAQSGQSSTAGTGGIQGGGAGAVDGKAGTPGQQYTGGGGGGSSCLTAMPEVSGGSGQVWICSVSPAKSTSGNPTYQQWDKGRHMYKFLGSGSIVF